jgi:hypothetical protein
MPFTIFSFINTWDSHSERERERERVLGTLIILFLFLQGTPLFTLDDVFLDSLEDQTTQTTEIVFQDTDLLSVNQLLESVCCLYHALLLSATCF